MSDQNKTSAFQRVCAAFPGVVWLRTHDMSRISYINPAVGDVFGITPEDIYAEPGTYIEAIHPDDRSEYRTLLETVRDRADGRSSIDCAMIVPTSGSWRRYFPLKFAMKPRSRGRVLRGIFPNSTPTGRSSSYRSTNSNC